MLRELLQVANEVDLTIELGTIVGTENMVCDG